MGNSSSTGRSESHDHDQGNVGAAEPATAASPYADDEAPPQPPPPRRHDDDYEPVDDVERQLLTTNIRTSTKRQQTSSTAAAAATRARLHDVLVFGQSAVAYGCLGSRVEPYLCWLLLRNHHEPPSDTTATNTQTAAAAASYPGCRCIRAHVSITNAEIMASATFLVSPASAAGYNNNNNDNSDNTGETGDDVVTEEEQTFTEMLPVEGGMSLFKLGALAELAKDVKAEKITFQQAVHERLAEIEALSPLYNDPVVLVCGYVASGFGLAILLRGGWWDVLLASAGAALVWLVGFLLDGSGRFAPAYFSLWVPFLSAFLPAVLASVVFATARPQVNVILASVSSVAIPLPGFTVTLGVAELVRNRIVRGVGHLVQGVVVLLWLFLGVWLGSALVLGIAGVDYNLDDTADVPLAQTWYFLAVPALAVSLSVAFYVPHRDFPWTFLICCMAYAVTYAASFIKRDTAYLGTFLAAAVTTMCANTWSWYFDRPQTIAMLPGIVFLVAGSGGLLGLLNWDTGGVEQFASMFIIALVIVIGVLAGTTVLHLPTTL